MAGSEERMWKRRGEKVASGSEERCRRQWGRRVGRQLGREVV
jgi:hypothetical protein